jgi:hypothetical protein
MLFSRKIPVKSLACLAGLIVSLSHCLGPAASISILSMYANLEDSLSVGQLSLEHKSNIGWSLHISCCTTTVHELQYWFQHLCSVNGQPFQRSGQVCLIEADLDPEVGLQGSGGYYICPLEKYPSPLLYSWLCN